jgi:outer membrane protein assembly factor BamB
MKKLPIFLLALLTLFPAWLSAQEPAARWATDLDGRKINWMKMAPNGEVLLVGDEKMVVYGISVATGETLWENKGIRPVLGKLGLDKTIKETFDENPDQFYENHVFFDLEAENPAVQDVAALMEAGTNTMTLINIKTGKVLNVYPGSEAAPIDIVMPAYFFDEERVLVGANEFGTKLLRLPDGEPIWENEHAFSSEPLFDAKMDIYANNSPVITDGTSATDGRGASQSLGTGSATDLHLTKIDGQTGQTRWQIDQNSKERFGLPMLTFKEDGLLFFRLGRYDNQVESLELVDTQTGDRKWAMDLSKEKAVINYASLAPNDQVFYLILQRNKRIDFLAIDMASGQERWNQEFKLKKEDGLDLVATDFGAAAISRGRVRMFDLATGNEKWEYSYNNKLFGTLINSPSGNLLLLVGNELEAINPESGETVWDAKGGEVKKFYADRVLVDFKGKGSAMIDLKTGDRIWKNKVLLSQIVADVPGIGIVYKETDSKGRSEMNILDPATGEQVWEVSIEEPGAQALTPDRKLIIYSEGRLVKVDPQAGRYDLFCKDVPFEEKETPDRIERVEGGYLVSSSQNLMLVDDQGKLLYHTHYQSVPQSGFKKALAIAGAAAAIAAAAASTADAAVQGANAGAARTSGDYSAASYYQRRSDMSADAAVAWASLAGNAMAMFSKRFKATQSSANYTFMLTKDGGDIKVVKLRKTDGEKERELIFKEREPVYRYDAARQLLYYRTANSEVTCFEF